MSRNSIGPPRLLLAAREAFRRGVVDLSASMVLVLGLGFLQNLVLARVLGPDGLGHLAVVNTVMGFSTLLATAGLTTSVIRYAAAAREPAAAWAIFRTSARLAAICAVGFTIVLAVLTTSPLWVFDPVAGAWLPLAALTLPLHSLGSCATQYCQAREHTRARALLELNAKLLLVICVVSGSLFDGFRGAILGFVVGSTLGNGASILFAYSLRQPRQPSAIPVRELMRFGLWGVFTNFLGLVLLMADILCISALSGDASAVGFYSIAAVFQQLVRVPMRAYLDARFPEMTRTSSDVLALRRLRRRMGLHLMGLAIGSVTLVGALAPWGIPFAFGERFEPSVAPLLILLAGHLFWSAGAAHGRSMLAAGWPEGNFWAALLAAAVNIALNLFLIPRFGIEGAAFATAASNAAWGAAAVVMCRRLEAGRIASIPPESP